jgi:Protein involved in initiation of plasmid replication
VRFIDDLESTYDKLMDLRFGRRSASGLTRERFVLFTEFKINGDTSEPYAEIQVHEKAIPLLNNLDEWTRYSLQQFNELQSSYSKTMYRLLKQFRTKGFAYFSKEDLHELLDIPKSYNQGTIDQRVFSPIRQELTAIFKGLTVKKKYGRGRGKPVIGYQFTFKAEMKQANDFNKHAPTKEEQQQALDQANQPLQEEISSSSIETKIKEQEQKLALLKKIKALESEGEGAQKKAPDLSTDKSTTQFKDEQDLLDDLHNLFS